MDWTKDIATELATGERELPELKEEEDEYDNYRESNN